MDVSRRQARNERGLPGMEGPMAACPMCSREVVAAALVDLEDGGRKVCVRCSILVHEREEALA